MLGAWRSVELFLPGNLSRDEVRAELRTRLLRAASDCGEFVHGIRIEGSVSHTDGWRKWSAAYMSGPPGLFYGSARADTATIPQV
jgi:hypothetical protein